MYQINIHQAKTQLSKPVARLLALEQTGRKIRQPGGGKRPDLAVR